MMMQLLLVPIGLLLGASFVFGGDYHDFCEDSISEINVNEMTELGFSGKDLVNHALYSNNLQPPSRKWQWNFLLVEGIDSRTNVRVSLKGYTDKARYTQAIPIHPECSTNPELCSMCIGRLEVDATISFETEDGLLNETWPVTLFDTGDKSCFKGMCQTPGVEANFRSQFELENIEGTLPNFYTDLERSSFWIEGKFADETVYAEINPKGLRLLGELGATFDNTTSK